MQFMYTVGAMEAYINTNKAEAWRKHVKKFFENCSDDFKIINPTDFYTYSEE